MMSAIGIARIDRATTRFRRRLAALNRSSDWYFGGGKRFFDRYYAEMAASHRWCFIVGCNNSGTSLLQSVLTETGVVSEMDGEGQLHTETLRRGHRRGYGGVWTEYLADLRIQPDYAERVGPRLAHDWLAAYPLPLKGLLLEKSTVNAVRMPFLQRVFPRSYFLGLVRDGYAVSEGIRRKTGSSLVRAARHWNLVNKIMIEDSGQIDRYLEIRYEDLSARPDNVVDVLSGFLKLEPEAISKALSASYSRSTIQGSGTRKIGNMNTASWSRLSPEDIVTIEDAAGEMLQHFEYNIDETQPGLRQML